MLRLDMSTGSGQSMPVESISTADDEPLKHNGPGEDGTLLVHLDAPGPVTIDYSFALDDEAHETFGYDLIFSIEPGSYWYPDVVNPDGSRDRFHDFEVVLEYPASHAVLTTGGEGEQENDGEWVRATYRAEHVEGFALAIGEGFVVERHDEGHVPIVAFFNPDHADAFATVRDGTAEAAAWYAQTYGFFPVPVVGVIQGHPRWGGGFPLPNMFMVHLGHLRDDFLAFITAHELGHYYWGLHVLGDEERLDWLMLANGIWADQLYLAQRSGRTLEEQWRHAGNGDWILHYLMALVANHEQQLGLTSAETGDLGFDYNSLIRHGKGATGLFLQARRAGTKQFLELQRELLREYQHRPLPVAEFVARIEHTGAKGATAFFEAWKRGDARLGMIVDEVTREDENSRIVLRRTGNVPYPIEVEVETVQAGSLRHVVAAETQRDTIRVQGFPVDVRLDPDGVVPMWSTSHPEMRSLLVRALGRAELDGAFIPLARDHLQSVPGDDRVRYLLMQRLFELARWEEAVALWSGGPCGSRDQCRAGIYASRAYAQLGETERAEETLESVNAGSHEAGLAHTWRNAADEILPARQHE
jgi:hypothetical protein